MNVYLCICRCGHMRKCVCMYGECAFLYTECLSHILRPNAWHTDMPIWIWKKKINIIFRFIDSTNTANSTVEYSTLGSSQNKYFTDIQYFLLFSLYYTMSDVVLSKPSSLFFHWCFICAIQIISLSSVAFSRCLIVFYRLSGKKSNQGSKCPWPRGRAADISCASGPLSHDCVQSSEKRTRVLLCFCVSTEATSKLFAYLTLLHQSQNPNHVNSQVPFYCIRVSQRRLKSRIQKQFLHRNYGG